MAYDEVLADRVREAVAERTDFVEKKMFGGLAFMVNTHMACGLVGTDLMVRVGAANHDEQRLLRVPERWTSPAGPCAAWSSCPEICWLPRMRWTTGSTTLSPTRYRSLRKPRRLDPPDDCAGPLRRPPDPAAWRLLRPESLPAATRAASLSSAIIQPVAPGESAGIPVWVSTCLVRPPMSSSSTRTSVVRGCPSAAPYRTATQRCRVHRRSTRCRRVAGFRRPRGTRR